MHLCQVRKTLFTHLPSSLITAGPVFNDCTTVTKPWALFTVKSPERRWRNRAFTPLVNHPSNPPPASHQKNSNRADVKLQADTEINPIKRLLFMVFAHLLSCNNFCAYCFGTRHLFADLIIGQINSDSIYQTKTKGTDQLFFLSGYAEF